MEKTKVTENFLPVYDYVIVGGGTAGCVLANRLSEDTSRTVLLLEAGPDDQEFPDIHIPAKWGSLQRSSVDWEYKTVPQKHACKSLTNQQMLVPRGKVLGGSGSLNALVYCRGTPQDFNLWEKTGCDGWGYEQVLPYFIKSENCLHTHLLTEGVHGSDGPMTVTESKYSFVSDVFIKAGLELGYKETDNNGRDPIGVMRVQINTDDGLRAHTAPAFLRPAMNRPNLNIVTNCHVTKLLIDNEIARAVEFTRLYKKECVRAKREIILSAGTIGSAQLLLLSGIGPRQHLEEIGIPVVADLPVGVGLQDHVMVHGIEFDVDKPTMLGSDPFSEENIRLYETMRSGPLATNLGEGIAFLRTPSQSPEDINPAIQIYAYAVLQDKGWETNTGMRKDYWNAMFPGKEQGVGPGMTLYPLISHPKSKGTLRLQSDKPCDYPLIDPQYLSHPEDVKTLVEAIKICQEFGNTNAYRSLGAKSVIRLLPGYKGTPYTDEYWEEYARALSQSVYHLVGTCRMGGADDKTTVVDPQLRVKGIERLRVVDASVIPEITSGNTNAPVVMIAEKAADMIKGVNMWA